MFQHSFLSITLHTGVDGGENTKTIIVDVIWMAIALQVLVAPTIKGVFLPGDGIDDKLGFFPTGIVFLLGLHGHHILTDIFTEIGGDAVLQLALVGLAEMQLHRLSGKTVVIGLGDITAFLHLGKDDVAAFTAALGITNGIVVRWVLAQTNKRGGLVYR